MHRGAQLDNYSCPSSRSAVLATSLKVQAQSALKALAQFTTIVAGCLLVLLAPPRANGEEQEYILRSGDTIELFIVTALDLRGKFTVQADGSVTLPLLGRLKAHDVPLSHFQSAAKAEYALKAYRGRTTDGREFSAIIQPSDVVISVVEYRPVYVTGDVSRPGEQMFRPGKTARQAIAVAGGPDVIRYRANHPGIDVADAKGEYDILSIEIAKRKLTIWRLQRELGGPDRLDLNELRSRAVDTTVINDLIGLERKLFDNRTADFKKQSDGLHLLAKEINEQLQIMSDQLEKEEKGRVADSDELQKVQELYGKGALPSPRVTEARRAVLLSATRKLQIESQIAQYRRQKSDIASSILRLDGQRAIEIQDRLVTEGSTLAAAEVKLAATVEKIHYLGMLKSSLRAPDSEMFQVAIYREGKNFTATQDTDLLPGDVVDVTLRLAIKAVNAPNRLPGIDPTRGPAPSALAPRT